MTIQMSKKKSDVVELIESYMRWTSEAKWDRLIELYADDVVIEFPFALAGPKRLEGIGTIRQAYSVYDKGPMQMEVRIDNVVIHETTDPEVVIVEYDTDGRVTSTGRSFKAPNIQVMRVQAGRIVHSKGYHNDLIRAAATGMVQPMVAALTGEGPKA
ncbi:MAG: nuclear transport factor 2 family protein [Steroidobacteraceae bacterium]